MLEHDKGLTLTYNDMKDPACDDAHIIELRKLHEEMDRVVLDAYAKGDPEGRWLDIEVPPFCPLNDDDQKKLERFEDAVIDRLFVLNAKRSEEEKIKGLGGAVKQKTKKRKSAGAKKAAERARKPKPPVQQLLIAGTEPTDTD